MANVKTDELRATRKNLAQESVKESNPLYGIYIGIVRSTKDKSRQGKITVFIPSLQKDPSFSGGETICSWTSPFAGATSVAGTGTNLESYVETQKSYGMWMIPPDVGNTVLVAFGDGDPKFPYIVGCTFPGQFNHMVPGMPGGSSYGEGKLQVPVAEKNKKEGRIDHDSKEVRRPIAPYLTEQIVKQGLIKDPMRGPGTAGARRQDPSDVYGILTPGPLKPGSNAGNTAVNAHRIGGHQFIMDDNPASSMIRFRTGRGTQFTLNDSNGTIYMINRDGTAWIELTAKGDILVYGEGSLNIRAKQNLNIRADKNVNIEAGNDINLRAAGDNVGDQYLGPNPAIVAGGPPLGTGGAIRLDAASDIQQFAALNFGVTSAGGDIDMSAAGRFAATASGPFGVDLLAVTGPIKQTATASGISMQASAGIGLTSGAPIGLVASRINLNSGPGFTQPAIVATGPGPLGLNEHKDQPAAAPEFDMDAALAGKTAIKNNGDRPGKADIIKSIVTNLVTAEPYSGHPKADDSGKADPTAVAESDRITEDMPPAASTTEGKPDDAQTPSGTKAGDGYVDSNGNTVSQPNNSPSQSSKAKNLAASAQARAQGGAGSINAAANRLNQGSQQLNAELSNLLDKVPTYADIQNAINDFGAAMEKKIDEVLGLSAFVASIRAMVPPIRFPTVNALQQRVLASFKQLKELEAQLSQFSLDKLGLPLDLNFPAIQDMKNQINGVMAQATSGLDAVNRLKELGIDVVSDAGSIIYRDSLGNTLVDFGGGVGPVASSLAIQSELTRTFNNVRGAIRVPINNNQSQALAAFSKDIGEENFRNSNVLKALNEGRYNEVPRLMMQWSLGPEPGSNVPTPTSELVFRADFQDKRFFQGQVFQSPDNLNIAPPEGTADGELTPRQLGDIIKARREEFNAANYVGPTDYYAGPR
jgi:hypothetical protein